MTWMNPEGIMLSEISQMQEKKKKKSMISLICELSVQFSFLPSFHFMSNDHYSCCLVTQLCQTLSNPTDCSIPGFPVLHYITFTVIVNYHYSNS